MKLFYTFSFLLLFSLGFSQKISIIPFASGFVRPVEIEHPKDDPRLFVVENGGAIKILNPDATVNETNFLTLSDDLISTGSEQGLLGMCFHPEYATNGYFYINYINTNGNTVVERYSVDDLNPDIANPNGTIIITITQIGESHNGGTIKFGPDGYLYIGMGDGAYTDNPYGIPQDLTNNLGKMLRIDVDAASPYGIPPTNPYIGIDGNDEIWASGLRNPWKFSFDRLNGDLWIADVGQQNIEEINKIASPLPSGLNFGWRCYEGTSIFYENCADVNTTYTFPFVEYTHDDGSCSVTGGYVYRGSLYPNFVGKYFFADFCQTYIGTVDTEGKISYSESFPGVNLFTTFGEDADGELYVTNLSGIIYKIVDSTLSLNTFNNNAFSVYPNPTQNLVNITSKVGFNNPKIEIYDLLGRMINQQSFINQKEAVQLNVASLKTGVYIIVMKENNKIVMQKKLQIQ